MGGRGGGGSKSRGGRGRERATIAILAVRPRRREGNKSRGGEGGGGGKKTEGGGGGGGHPAVPNPWTNITKDPTEGLPPIVMTEKWLAPDVQPKKGEGWLGHGAPLRVRQGHMVRDLEDGAGICSPGRWSPAKRKLSDIEGFAEKLSAAMNVDPEAWHKSMPRMMAVKQIEAPFTTDQIKKGKQFLETWLAGEGFARTPSAADVQQDPDLRLLQAFLRRCKDPDAEALDAYCHGVRLGYLSRMPRATAVFNAKEKRCLRYELGDVPADPSPPIMALLATDSSSWRRRSKRMWN